MPLAQALAPTPKSVPESVCSRIFVHVPPGRAVRLVDVELLLHAAVRQIVDHVFVPEPRVHRHGAAPVSAVHDRRGARMVRLLLEIDVPVVAHARAEPARVALVDVFVAGGPVVRTRDAGEPGVRRAAVGDATEIHRHLDVSPLIDECGVVNVHARHRAGDDERAVTRDAVRRVSVVRVEPVVIRVFTRERARGSVPLRVPDFAARERRVELFDAERIEARRPNRSSRPCRRFRPRPTNCRTHLPRRRSGCRRRRVAVPP